MRFKRAIATALLFAMTLQNGSLIAFAAEANAVGTTQEIVVSSSESQSPESNGQPAVSMEGEEVTDESKTQPQPVPSAKPSEETVVTDEESLPTDSTVEQSPQVSQQPQSSEQPQQNTGWYENESGERFYLEEDGTAKKGWHMIDGKRYYFDETTGVQQKGFQLFDNVWLYYYDEQGQVFPEGWNELEGQKCYVSSGGSLSRGKAEIEGSLYYFDQNGAMKTGWIADGTDTYFAQADGKLLQNQWANNSSHRYYFGQDGAMFKGWQMIDGRRYHFNEATGEQLMDFQLYANTWWYYYDASGNLMPEGWNDLNGTRRYVSSGGSFFMGKNEIDGKQYIFASDGVLQYGWIELDGQKYYAGSDGALVENSWETIEGKRYYFDDKGQMVKGWYMIDGRRYHFNEFTGEQLTDFQLYENTWWYYYDADGNLFPAGWNELKGTRRYVTEGGSFVMGKNEIDGKKYIFGPSGILQYGWIEFEGQQYYAGPDGALLESGWQTVQGKRYYIDETGLPVKGWHMINGRRYHFNEFTGEQLTDFQLYENTWWYYYDADGNLFPAGWNELKGTRRYVTEGGSFVMGKNEIDGKEYVFGSSGILQYGWIELDGQKYYAGSDGALVKNNWQTIDGKRYYFDDKGQIVKGWYMIDGRRYHFNEFTGEQLTDFQLYENTWWYYYDANGNLLPAGWNELKGTRRYVTEGGSFVMGKNEIDGDLYIFGSSGILQYGWVSLNGQTYYAQQDGKLMRSQWGSAAGKRYYFGNDGSMQKGWQAIENRWYLLDYNTGEQVKGLVSKSETQWFYYDETGALPPKGWYYPDWDNSVRYVLDDGSFASGKHVIDGKNYVFGPSGIMMETAVIVDGKAYDSNNPMVLLKNKWVYDYNANRYYASSDGSVLKGWQMVDGRRYCFHEVTGVQQLGLQQYAGTWWYYYDNNGNLMPAGWNDWNGQRYFVTAGGSFAMGVYDTGNGKYLFNSQGVLQKGWYTENGNTYHSDSEGRVTFGWYNENGQDRYYFDGNGIMLKGWQTINGNLYYFHPQTGIAYRDGLYEIDGKKYTFDINGVATEVKPTPNPNQAIDVSYHQGLIDWRQVANSGIQYAIIRAVGWDRTNQTVGGVDTMFDYNVREAKKYGIKVGAYIYTYAKNESEILTEVNAFLGAMQKLERDGYKLDLPVFVDQEDNSLLQGLTYADRTRLLRYEMVVLEQKGYYPGMYMSTSWSQSNVDAEQLYRDGYDMWIADYRTSVQNPVWSGRCAMWQYSSTGKVPGINTNVDMNYLYKDYSGLIQGSDNTGSNTAAKFRVRNVNADNVVVEDTMLNLLAAIVNNEVGSGLGLTGADRMKLYQAQAIAAHSYLLYSYANSNEIPSVGLNYNGSYNTIREQIASVENQIVTYAGLPALTVYGSCNNGKTNASGDYWSNSVPYLVAGIESKYDKEMAPEYFPTVSRARTAAEVSAELKSKHGVDTSAYPDPSQWFVIDGRNVGGYITTLTICGKQLKGGTLNDNFSPIRSSDFTVEYDAAADNFVFKSYGNGHGIGMSQFGAAGYISKEGWGYEQVLRHYYPNTTISTVEP